MPTLDLTDDDLTETEEAVGEAKPYLRAEQEQRLAVADRKLTQLGRVNPLALEEFAALEQRHKFLTEQLGESRRRPGDVAQ